MVLSVPHTAKTDICIFQLGRMILVWPLHGNLADCETESELRSSA